MVEQEYRMTGTEPAYIPPQASKLQEESETGASEVVETRFGKVKIYRKNPITFTKGLLGMPDKFQFCLTSMPNEKLARFKLLQSIEDNELSFITLPADVDNPIIDRKDVEQACQDMSIAQSDVAILFIVSVHRRPGAVQLSVNARAPIFMDAQKRTATQYVFNTNKYAIQHMITL